MVENPITGRKLLVRAPVMGHTGKLVWVIFGSSLAGGFVISASTQSLDYLSNNYGLPEDALKGIRLRDQLCVYCHKRMAMPSLTSERKDWATIEHLNHLPPWNNPETVAICCMSCNSSRGAKELPLWFKTSYCLERHINEETVTEPVKRYLRLYYEPKGTSSNFPLSSSR